MAISDTALAERKESSVDRNIACRRTAQKCVREGDIEQAVESYEEVVSSGDADPYDYVYAGDLYIKLDLIEEAVGRFRRGVSAYSRLGFNRNAIALCRRIVRLDAGQLDVQRELGDLFATEELFDDALEAYMGYLEGVDSEAREDEAFRETLARIEELAPRRPAYAVRLSEFLESLGHTEASVDVLSRAADLARSAGTEDVARELMERALGLNPALAKAAEVANSIEERLAQVHRSKAHSGAGTEDASVNQEETAEAAGPPAAGPGVPYEIPEEEAGEDPAAIDEELTLAGFQEVDFAAGDGGDGSSAREIEPLQTIEQRRAGAGRQTADLPSVGPLEIQSSAHPAAAALEPERIVDPEAPAADSDAPGQPGASSAANAPTVPAAAETTPVAAPLAIHAEASEEQDPGQAAREAIRAEDWKLARRWVEAWLLTDPTSHEAADAMILACEAQQDRAGIIEGLTLKGDLLIQGQELPAAVPLFWRVLEMDPQNETARRRMARFREIGLVASDAGPGFEADAASEEAEAAVVEGGSRDGADESAGRSEKGEAAQRRQMKEGPIVPARALAVLAELRGGPKRSVDPQQSETHHGQGLVHMEMGRLAEALVAFDVALAEPGLDAQQNVKIWELRGKCLSGLGRHRDAIAEVEAVLAGLEPSDRGAVALQYFLALEHETLGEFDAARERLGKVIASAPDFEQASRRLSQLDERAA